MLSTVTPDPTAEDQSLVELRSFLTGKGMLIVPGPSQR
jgi:hypothetical protein